MNESFKVYVSCMTYNQSAYIKDALDGFCMQQTSFPYVCGIIDDASTDGEQEVIRDYLDKHFDLSDSAVVKRDETDDFFRIIARHKDNKNCFFVVVFLKYNHYSINKDKIPYVAEWRNKAKYIALCEGDDYWIAPFKLQKQVEFMDTHEEHSLCFCAHAELLPSGEQLVIKRYDTDWELCPMKDIIDGGGGYMATNSMLYRQSLYKPYQTWAVGCPIGDLPMMLSLANTGKVGFLSEVMCVHRQMAMGSWTSVMASSIKLRRRHHKAIIRMWKQFDCWSGRKYHPLVSKKIRVNQINHIKNELVAIRFFVFKR